MTELAASLAKSMPKLRGKLSPQQSLAESLWFRVGGKAEALFQPADEDDLAYFLSRLPADVPYTVIGLGSNLLVRDGGLPGVTIRLGKPFAMIAPGEGGTLWAGAAAADKRIALEAMEAGIGGFAFLAGIPGALGGALAMNAGANGTETSDRVVEVFGFDRAGDAVTLSNDAMGYSYRHASAPDGLIFTGALMQGSLSEREAIKSEIDAVIAHREASQPTRSRTGGSTFKNPPGQSAWKLVDEAGCRGLTIGGAQVSELHTNFLLNVGGASAADIEALGEEVRRRVMETSGVELEWEIKRIGVAA